MKYLLLRMKPSLLRIKFELNLEYKKESYFEISYEIKKGSASPFDTLCIFDLQILFLFCFYNSITL